MGWFGITLNEWLFAGFLILLVLVVPKLSDFGEWVARRTGPASEAGPAAGTGDKTPPPPRVEDEKPRRKRDEPRDEERSDRSDD